MLDPFAQAGGIGQGQGFNPLAEIDTSDAVQTLIMATSLADALITHEGKDPHWSESARELLLGIILLVLCLPEEERNLITVRGFISLSRPEIDAQKKIIEEIKGKDIPPETGLFSCMELEGEGRYFGTLTRIANAFAAVPERELGSIWSVLRRQTAFLESPAMADVLKTSSFELADLKRERVTLYLCLPAGEMGFFFTLAAHHYRAVAQAV